MTNQVKREAFEASFKLSEIFKRESRIRNKDILEFSETAGIYFNIIVNDAWNMWQAASIVPEGFVLIPRVITEEWMEAYVGRAVDEYCKDFENLPYYVRENELSEVIEDHRKPIRIAHKRLMQVIEAQEQNND